MSKPTRTLSNLRKVARYAGIYGVPRTLAKAAGRLPGAHRLQLPRIRPTVPADCVIAGCGQFGFSTIGYFVHRAYGRRFLSCYDIDPYKSDRFREVYRTPYQAADIDALLSTAGAAFLFVASNHASHSDYAIAGLKKGLTVYVEKPVSVDRRQLSELSKTVYEVGADKIRSGYNRPHSPAILELKPRLAGRSGPLSLNCHVNGHLLAGDHWYRRPGEGTRICGNMGHWIDLAVHILHWQELPDRWHINIAYSNMDEPDDNIAVTLTSERGDLVSIMLTARSEPFEGISETINLQVADTICKIDDFRRMQIWQGETKRTWRYWPKDVGHRNATLGLFSPPVRDWREVEQSTLLMLDVREMVEAGETERSFSFADRWRRLQGCRPLSAAQSGADRPSYGAGR